MTHNLLLVEGNSADARCVLEALMQAGDEAYRIERVRTCSEAMERLAREGQPPDDASNLVTAVMLDLFLSDSRGIETFERIAGAARQIPILVLSSPKDESVAKLAVQKGAQDYLVKTHVDGYTLPKALESMVERAANVEKLFQEKERAQITLDSIGDAVMSTDVKGQVTYLNSVAERLTGWPLQEAAGRPLEDVLRIIDETTRESVPNPLRRAIRENKTVGLTPNCALVRRDGVETAIEDSAAPIHDRRGQVTGAVIVFHDVSATRALSLQVSHLAQHDSLTDLPNRALFKDRLNHAIALAHRHRQQLAVLFLDVDRFKSINDTLGHSIGDRLLQSLSARLLASVRSSDTVSRQGGDEFVILLSELTHARDAAVAADKILLSLGAAHHVDAHELMVTASIGIVTYPGDGMDAETLMKNADIAMYDAKGRGRNNHQFFRPEMDVGAINRTSSDGHGPWASIRRTDAPGRGDDAGDHFSRSPLQVPDPSGADYRSAR